MDENQADIDLLTTMGDSIAIDYGVSILKTSNCSAQFKNGCSPREKLHFRFWPGNVSPHQTSQGLMALCVMLVLLCLVVTYCCWGTCCKVFQKRRQRTRSRSQMSFDSTGSWPSDPRLMSLWSPQSHSYEAPTSNRRETSRNDSRLSVETKPRWHHDVPPSYEVLFCPEMNFCSPPTYSSLELNQQLCSTGVSSNNPPTLVNELVANSSNPFVTVVIERESETTSDEQNLSIPKSVARFHRSQSVPASIGSSGQITHISVLFHTNNREA